MNKQTEKKKQETMWINKTNDIGKKGVKKGGSTEKWETKQNTHARKKKKEEETHKRLVVLKHNYYALFLLSPSFVSTSDA